MPQATVRHHTDSVRLELDSCGLKTSSSMTAVTDLGFGARVVMVPQASKEAASGTCCTFDVKNLHGPDVLCC